MSDDNRAETNRRNSKRSTGPTTLEGRATSKMNALRHGLTARAWLLPDESPEDFAAAADRLRADLAPVGAVEDLLADRVVTGAWRLGRVLRVEAGVFERGMIDRHGLSAEETAGVAFARDSSGPNAFGNLARYEFAIERGLTAALHELHRLQAARTA